LLYNALGRHEDALAAGGQASEFEAAARSGHAELAADALERHSEITRASGTDWALGVEARSRAVLSEGEVAEDLQLGISSPNNSTAPSAASWPAPRGR
jgi:hypothetical protein